MRDPDALVALVLLTVCLAGCQHFGHPPGRARTSPDVEALSPTQQADLQVALGRTLENRGEMDRAINAYRAALKQDQGRADASLRLAVLHDHQGQFRESAEFYRRALEARPGDADTYCDMGYSLYLQHRLDEAEMNLRQALAIDPGHRRGHNNLGLLLAHDDRLDEAIDEFRRGGCTPADAHLNLAFVLTVARRWPEAREHYHRALDADPSSEIARGRLRELEALIAQVGPPPTATARDGDAIPASATSDAAP